MTLPSTKTHGIGIRFWIALASAIAVILLILGIVKISSIVVESTKFNGVLGGYAETEDELHPQIQEARGEKSKAYDVIGSVVPITSVMRSGSIGSIPMFPDYIPDPSEKVRYYSEIDSVYFPSVEDAEKAAEVWGSYYIEHGYKAYGGDDALAVMNKGEIVEGSEPLQQTQFSVIKGFDKDESVYAETGMYEKSIYLSGFVKEHEWANGQTSGELYVNMLVLIDATYNDLPKLVGNKTFIEMGLEEALEEKRIEDGGEKRDECWNRTHDSIHFMTSMGDWVDEYGCKDDPTPLKQQSN